MPFDLIYHLVQRFKMFRHLHSLYRIDDTSFCIEFEKNHRYCIDLSRGTSLIYPIVSCPTTKHYQAPFDKTLSKRCTNGSILEVSIPNNDRIIRWKISRCVGYKIEVTLIQCELTGRHVNLIIMDEDHKVLEAFRHIDPSVSSRPVCIGSFLQDPPMGKIYPRQETLCDDIDATLLDLATKREEHVFCKMKENHTSHVQKLLAEVEKIKKGLPTAESLYNEGELAQHRGHVLLANKESLTLYQTSFEGKDFEGKEMVISLPKVKTLAQIPEYFFKLSKKLKNKALNITIQHEHIEGKISFLKRLLCAISDATTPHDLSILFPKKEAKRSKHTSPTGEWETFLIEGYRVLVGKNGSGNKALLQGAKATDMWFHLKDRPSAHVIVPTQKTMLPLVVIEHAAKLCARFSVDFGGEYEVDYTQRRHVKPKENANCLYVNYKTIKVAIP